MSTTFICYNTVTFLSFDLSSLISQSVRIYSQNESPVSFFPLPSLCRAPSNRVRGAPFRPVRAMAVDLFPQTMHCETILLFERVVYGSSSTADSSSTATAEIRGWRCDSYIWLTYTLQLVKDAVNDQHLIYIAVALQDLKFIRKWTRDGLIYFRAFS